MGAVSRRLKARAWVKLSDVPIHCNNESSLRGIVRHFGAYHRRSVSADAAIGPEEAVLLVDYGGDSFLPRHMNLIIGSLCYVLTISIVEELPYVPLSTASLLKADLIPEPRRELLNLPSTSTQPPQPPPNLSHGRKGKEKMPTNRTMPTSRKLFFLDDPVTKATAEKLPFISDAAPLATSSPTSASPSSHVAATAHKSPQNFEFDSLPQNPQRAFSVTSAVSSNTQLQCVETPPPPDCLLQLKPPSHSSMPESDPHQAFLLNNSVVIIGNHASLRQVNLNHLGNIIHSWSPYNPEASSDIISQSLSSVNNQTSPGLTLPVGPFNPLGLTLPWNGQPNTLKLKSSSTCLSQSLVYPTPQQPASKALTLAPSSTQSPPTNAPVVTPRQPPLETTSLQPSSSTASHTFLSADPFDTLPSSEGIIIQSPLSPMGSLDAVDYGTSDDDELGVVDISTDTPMHPDPPPLAPWPQPSPLLHLHRLTFTTLWLPSLAPQLTTLWQTSLPRKQIPLPKSVKHNTLCFVEVPASTVAAPLLSQLLNESLPVPANEHLKTPLQLQALYLKWKAP